MYFSTHMRINKDEENNEQDAEPSTQQQYDDGNVMRHFRDHVTELM